MLFDNQRGFAQSTATQMIESTMVIVPSTCQADDAGWNSCPEKKIIERAFSESWEWVNVLNRQYWQNEMDTFILRLRCGEENALPTTYMELAEFLAKWQPDEFDYEQDTNGDLIVRIWFD